MASLLYVLAHSTDAPERAATGVHLALAAQEAGHDVRLWLHGEGVRLGVRGVAETLREPGAQSVAEALEALTGHGAVLYCHEACFHRREFEADALREGAEVVGGMALAALVADGRTPVSV